MQGPQTITNLAEIPDRRLTLYQSHIRQREGVNSGFDMYNSKMLGTQKMLDMSSTTETQAGTGNKLDT